MTKALIKIIKFIFIIKEVKKLEYNYCSVKNDKYDSSIDFLNNQFIEELVTDKEYEVKIFSTNMKLELNEFNFEINFEDEEAFFCLHRFGWLKVLIVETKNAKLKVDTKKFILKWIDLYLKEKENKKIWESYSVSERIVNWIYFDLLFTNILDDKRIEFALKEHVEFLIENLEYRGYLTQNHILNNARALYFYAIFFKNKEILKIAKDLFYKFTPLLVSNKGFVKEGSVHYHFLLTRTFIELAILSKNRDLEFHTFIKRNLDKMLNYCEFFLIKDNDEFHMPLIGDVSPDFSTEWLISIVEIAKKKLEYKSIYNYSSITNNFSSLF